MKSVKYVTRNVLEFLIGENGDNVSKWKKNANFKFKDNNLKST